MSNDLKLGQIITDAAHRDAIHVAVAPVVADQQLQPGAKIGFVNDDAERVCAKSKGAIGIVDPFLTTSVKRGQRFWMFLFPNTVTGMRHEWQHPAFANARSVENAHVWLPGVLDGSDAWLRKHADNIGLSYDALMAAADQWVDDHEYTTQLGSETWRDGYDPQFWEMYEKVRGKTVAKKENFFSCSC